MPQEPYRIIGRITKVGAKDGVHGLQVRVMGNQPSRARKSGSLSSVLTRRDGGFAITLPRGGSVRLEILDRDDKVIHVPKQAYAVKRGTPLQLRFDLKPEALANHLSRPTTLEVKRGRLLSRAAFHPIRRAIGLFAAPGSQEFTRWFSIAFCGLPSIDGFGDILDIASGVLDGDLEALKRLRETLDVLAGPDQSRGQVAAASPDETIERIAKEFTQRAADFAPVEALLGREAFIPLILAAGISAQSEPKRLERHLRTALDQLGAYRSTGILHEAALGALSGGPQELGHFQAVLQSFEDWCPGDFPLPPDFPEIPEPEVPNPGRLEHWGCTAEAAWAFRFLRGRLVPRPATGSYRIDSVTPERACAGETLTITGVGFTSTPGAVRFSAHRRLAEWIDVTPTTWTDTEITVVSPVEALCGPLSLRIAEEVHTASVCDAFVDVSTYRPAVSPTTFAGCRPTIGQFLVNSGRTCVPRDNPANLTWTVHPPDAEVTIRQTVAMDTVDLFTGTGSGSLSLDTSVMETRALSITAINPNADCAESTRDLAIEIGPPAPTLTIAGIEVTQGIQRFFVDTPDHPDNNSVALIAGMDTIVRVFVRCERGGFNGDMARATGWLHLRRRGFSDSTPFDPINGSPAGSAPIIDAKPMPSRRMTDDSINFLIPAHEARGDVTLSVQVVSAEVCEDFVSIHTSLPVSWAERVPYPVTIRRITEPDETTVLSEAEALRIINTAFDRLPSPRTEIRMHPGVFRIHAGTTESNYCHDGGFYQLALSVAYEHNDTEGYPPAAHESAWVGMFSRSDCDVGGMMSWPSTSTCIVSPDPEIAAHELGHTVGLGHTRTGSGERCDDIAQPVACHDLPNGGQLTDVAFDIRNNVVIVDTWDLMSYHSGIRWPHPNHWEGLRSRMDTRF